MIFIVAVAIALAVGLGWIREPSFLAWRARRRGSNPAPPEVKPSPPTHKTPLKPQPPGGRLIREDRLEPGAADLAHPSREMLRRLDQLEEELRLAHMRIDQIIYGPLRK